MLAEFGRPNVVVCILCKGSVSVRNGDKTRFFNHISIDHEAHFDFDLFYAISFMSDREKNKFVELLYLKLQKEENSGTQHGASSDVKENVEQIHPETKIVVPENKEQTLHKSNYGFEENIIEGKNPGKVPEIKSEEKYSNVEMECSMEGSVNSAENVNEKQMSITESKMSQNSDIQVKIINQNLNQDIELPITKSKPEIILNSPPKKTQLKKELVKNKLCDQCDKKYHKTYELMYHIRTFHEGVKLSCDKCNYKSMRKASLTQHIRSVHDGIRYKCNQCNSEFKGKEHLKEHISAVHMKIKFPCDQCSFKATQKGQLSCHIKSTHREPQETESKEISKDNEILKTEEGADESQQE